MEAGKVSNYYYNAMHKYVYGSSFMLYNLMTASKTQRGHVAKLKLCLF